VNRYEKHKKYILKGATAFIRMTIIIFALSRIVNSLVYQVLQHVITFMLRVILLSVILMSVILMSFILMRVILMSVILLNIILLIVILMSVIVCVEFHIAKCQFA